MLRTGSGSAVSGGGGGNKSHGTIFAKPHMNTNSKAHIHTHKHTHIHTQTHTDTHRRAVGWHTRQGSSEDNGPATRQYETNNNPNTNSNLGRHSSL